MKKIKIIVAEDHTIVREGLKSLLLQNQDFEINGEAKNGLEAITLAKKLNPHLMIMDLSMPLMNGMEAIYEIKKECPETKIVVLTVHKTEEYVLASLKAGADGYLLKDATQEELIHAVYHVLNGKPYLSPDISEAIITGYLAWRRTGKTDTLFDTLTSREKQVLKLVAEGYTSKEIADYLYISVKTVEKHRENVMKKLDLHNATALTSYAIEKGLVST